MSLPLWVKILMGVLCILSGTAVHFTLGQDRRWRWLSVGLVLTAYVLLFSIIALYPSGARFP